MSLKRFLEDTNSDMKNLTKRFEVVSHSIPATHGQRHIFTAPV